MVAHRQLHSQATSRPSLAKKLDRMISHSDADADREAARGMLRSALNEAGADLGIADTHVPERVAAVVFQILLRMELLEDMGLLQELYDILCSYTVDGLAVSRYLRDICEEDDFLPNEARVNKLNGWILDRFMEQKWIKYIKRQEEMSLQWSEVSQKLAAFIVPIGQALANGNYYTGEWMPKIARYIG